MAKIGTSLPEVAILMTIPGIALKSTLCIIAELGDIRRSHSANAINAYIGVDLTTYQSGTIRPSSIFENVGTLWQGRSCIVRSSISSALPHTDRHALTTSTK